MEKEIKERSISPNKYNLDDEVNKSVSDFRNNGNTFRLNLIEATTPGREAKNQISGSISNFPFGDGFDFSDHSKREASA